MSGRLQTFLNYDGYDGAPGGAGRVSSTAATSFDPRLSMQWNVTPNISLRGAGSTAFRAPTLDNLYRSFSVPFGIFLPNAQLSPEKLWGFEAGFDLNWGAHHRPVYWLLSTGEQPHHDPQPRLRPASAKSFSARSRSTPARPWSRVSRRSSGGRSRRAGKPM